MNVIRSLILFSYTWLALLNNLGAQPQSMETTFVTVKDMLAHNGTNNVTVHLSGYYAAFDGGGGDFGWSTDTLMKPDSGLVFKPLINNVGRWVRILPDAQTMLNGKWFGLYIDNKHDDTHRLQVLVNSALEKGYGVKLPSGNIKITTPIYIGGTNHDYSGSAFNLEGNGIGVSLANGTKIILYGQSFPKQGVLIFQDQIGMRATMKYLSVECNTKYAADYGVLWNGTAYTGMMVEYVGVTGAKTAFGIVGANGRTANGEFTTFFKCFAEKTQGYFYMDSACAIGQAYNHLFIHNSATLVGDYAFQLGSGCQGFGIHALECEFSFSGNVRQPKGLPHTFFINNGVNGTMKFSGGRVEGCERLLVSNVHQGTGHCSFENMEFDGISKFMGYSLVAAQGKGATYTYTWQNCSFNESYKDSINHSRPFTIDLTQYGFSDRSRYYFDKCTFSGFSYPDIVVGGKYNSANLQFSNCSWRNDDSTTRARVPIQFFSKEYATASIFDLTERKSTVGTAMIQSGVPQNLLIAPAFGIVNGTVSAPYPWVHTGNSKLFAGLQHVPYIKHAATPDAFALQFFPHSGIYQDIKAAPLIKPANYLVYQALIQQMRGNIIIDLENSITGVVYDKLTLKAIEADTVNTNPQLVSLTCMTGADGGYLRLRIFNDGTDYGAVNFYNHFVTNKNNGTYVLPEDSSTSTFTNFWDVNTGTVKINGRLSLPYKIDEYGINTELPNDNSDIYISKTTGNLDYNSKGKKWQIPKSFYSAEQPSGNDFDEGTIAYAVHPTKVLLGWVFTGTEWAVINNGDTQASGMNSVIYIDPPKPVATHSVALPANAMDGEEQRIIVGGSIKNGLVVGNLSILPAKNQMLIGDNRFFNVMAGSSFLYKYRKSVAAWYRLP